MADEELRTAIAAYLRAWDSLPGEPFPREVMSGEGFEQFVDARTAGILLSRNCTLRAAQSLSLSSLLRETKVMFDEGLFRRCPRLLLFCFSRASGSALKVLSPRAVQSALASHRL
jgi:hypothetical protein